jgi:NAD dependent epimerase/dehydratase family enzyme
MMPAKLGFLVRTGNGLQYMPWIHIDDLCNIYLKAIEDPIMNGSYNAVSPQHVTNKDFMGILSKVMKISVIPVPVPAFILKLVIGEMSDIILKGSRISSEKLQKAGFKFLFNNLEDALKEEIC